MLLELVEPVDPVVPVVEVVDPVEPVPPEDEPNRFSSEEKALWALERLPELSAVPSD